MELLNISFATTRLGYRNLTSSSSRFVYKAFTRGLTNGSLQNLGIACTLRSVGLVPHFTFGNRGG